MQLLEISHIDSLAIDSNDHEYLWTVRCLDNFYCATQVKVVYLDTFSSGLTDRPTKDRWRVARDTMISLLHPMRLLY